MKPLTESQQKVLTYLQKKLDDGVPPSVREICLATGIRSTSTVHGILRQLEEAGYITREAGRNRSIRLEGRETTRQVPIIGVITAGNPILAFEDIQGYVSITSNRYGDKDLFALKVQGESMKNAGILDGDYVIAEQTSMVNNGDIVVALLEDEATVKRYFHEGDTIRLQPENDAFAPIYTKEVQVQGKVIGVVRYY